MLKVLVIDDETATLKMFRLFLREYGYLVFLAEDGEQGLNTVKKEKPQIIFTDIKMPGIDGFEVLKKIKEIDPRAEVIVITGHGDMDLAVQALNLGATDFIDKPIHRTALDSALGRAEERIKSGGTQEDQISWRKQDNVAIIDIKGTIVSVSEPTLFDVYKKASQQEKVNILLNFDEASSINGTGIADLIQLLTESKKNNQIVAISGISENFKHIFKMAGITRSVKIFNTQEEATIYLTAR